MRKCLILLAICLLLLGLSCEMGGNKMSTGYTYEQPDIEQDWGRARGRALTAFLTGQPYTESYPKVTPYEPFYDYGYTPPATEQTAWQRWQPYLQGLGIAPLPSGYLTATSPAFRERMNPEALLGMENYFSGMGKTWADYLDWTNLFMPRTPVLQQRRWMPWRWR